MKYGTIGTSWITETFIEATGLIDGMALAAVYSRDMEKGKAFAKKHNCGIVFSDLEEMADSSAVDAVYIASPNVFHYEHSKLFLSKGKHVICEKPACVTPKEVADLQELAKEKGVVYLEAIKMMHLPQRKLLHDAVKKIGKVSSARLDYSQQSSKYKSFLQGELPNIFNPKMATGCLMDIGVYCVYPAIDLFGEPQKIISTAGLLSGGADGFGFSIFIYEDKQICLSYSKIGEGYCGSEIVGEKGTILIESISQLDNIKIMYNDGTQETICGQATKAESMSYEAKNFLAYITNPGKYEKEYEYARTISLSVSKTMEIIREQCKIVF